MGYLKGKDGQQYSGCIGYDRHVASKDYLKVKSRSVDEKGDPLITFAKIDE